MENYFNKSIDNLELELQKKIDSAKNYAISEDEYVQSAKEMFELAELGIKPQINIHIPEEWDKQDQDKALEEILKAPQEYSNTMSKDDKYYLNYLNDKK